MGTGGCDTEGLVTSYCKTPVLAYLLGLLYFYKMMCVMYLKK